MACVLSFHPCLEAEVTSYPPARRPLAADDHRLALLAQARAVILPQGCCESLYRQVRLRCPQVFPNYDARFAYPGKLGQARLFAALGLPHPRTVIVTDFAALDRLCRRQPPLPYPFVFKCSWGGGGRFVFLIRRRAELERCRDQARDWRRRGLEGYLLQEYVPCRGRSLRVVVIAGAFHHYWRVTSHPDAFHANLARGARVCHHLDPAGEAAALALCRACCQATGINLAGFDFLFAADTPRPSPLFLEINYCFGCHGLGGPDRYHQLLANGVRRWLAQVLPPAPQATAGRAPTAHTTSLVETGGVVQGDNEQGAVSMGSVPP